MFTRILPRQVDNSYPGHRVSILLFVLLTARAVSGSLTHMFTADGGAGSIASMPLETYPTGAAENIITVFAIAGLYQLLTALFNVVVLVRYRSLIPLMYLFFVLEYVLRIAKPLYTPGGERGVYKSTDGGVSWEAILTLDEHTGASDLVMGIALIVLGIALIFVVITYIGKLLKVLMVGRAKTILHAAIGRGAEDRGHGEHSATDLVVVALVLRDLDHGSVLEHTS